jgi:hypothetical protein
MAASGELQQLLDESLGKPKPKAAAPAAVAPAAAPPAAAAAKQQPAAAVSAWEEGREAARVLGPLQLPP